ncbi:MAG TPA: FkbM family methyltransferase, partial [Xanthobacteraceae bacterium]|nr:FkbM family methyltransferase [Xanthobacteraceae bacterium]
MTALPEIAHRRPFFERLNTSLRKRWVGRDPASSPRIVSCRYSGARFEVDVSDIVGHEIAINRFEWRELKLMMAACERFKPDVLVDVGANLGLYTCVLGSKKLVPRLIAFEPDRENFSRLTTNLALNGLSGHVEAHDVAVGARFGTATLVPSAPANRGMSRIGSEPADNSYEVTVVTLDETVPHLGRNIAIKIDVEGFEDEVLSGATQLLDRNGGYAQIEAH